MVAQVAALYDVSRTTLYRLLHGERCPKDPHRPDRATSRIMPADEIEWWCEVAAAMKAAPPTGMAAASLSIASYRSSPNMASKRPTAGW
ncbi:hypothetical protein [uncultured Novosphingobium sp.]|uniref:hypothetical protein n=1 Tax=uncultured Novosphingobium sp. TaxID=292277 RepID=UPI002589E51D|nr:hypothetical protein [uncultured Novosphingobium sp.]